MKIGVLYGMENTFPPALVERINEKKVPGLKAEAIRIGCIKMAAPAEHAVLVDRISHDVEFYRAYLKNAALTGTAVLNDPFRVGAFDLFYACSAAAAAGVSVPRTAILPQKEHPPGITVQSLRNLQFPLDWEEAFDYVGFPAILKPLKPGRWKVVTQLQSADEFFAAYDGTGSAAMMLQQTVRPDESYRCYVVGDETRLMRYDPASAHGGRYAHEPAPDTDLHSRITEQARTTARQLGFDISISEFVVEDNTPYLVDVAYSSPDADRVSLGNGHFEWVVERVADLAIARALHSAKAKPVEHELAARV